MRKKPIPLSDLADAPEPCGNSATLRIIRAAFAFRGADHLAIASALSECALDERDSLAAKLFYEYALIESGRLVSTPARIHHRALFYRYCRALRGTLT